MLGLEYIKSLIWASIKECLHVQHVVYFTHVSLSLWCNNIAIRIKIEVQLEVTWQKTEKHEVDEIFTENQNSVCKIVTYPHIFVQPGVMFLFYCPWC